jgi:ubiquinone/menaquinone biosynthesis C-methylase UbiE
MAGEEEQAKVGSAELYDRYVGPLLTAPYAADLAHRLAGLGQGRVLELACGTGVVTRALDEALPPAVAIVATDVDGEMLEAARRRPATARVTWGMADALDLPFDDGAFDAVLCQFGVMFFSDRTAAFREVRRVLRPGGRFILNAWDSLAANAMQDTVARALADLFPDRAATFLDRAAFRCRDRDALAAECRAAGFAAVEAETVALSTRSPSAGAAAEAFAWGSGFGTDALALDPARFEEATRAMAEALAARFGEGPITAGISAHVVTGRR